MRVTRFLKRLILNINRPSRGYFLQRNIIAIVSNPHVILDLSSLRITTKTRLFVRMFWMCFLRWSYSYMYRDVYIYDIIFCFAAKNTNKILKLPLNKVEEVGSVFNCFTSFNFREMLARGSQSSLCLWWFVLTR